jgi:hypothetical protein
MRLCWADKVPLALFAIITLILLFLGINYCVGSARRGTVICGIVRA